MTPEEHNNWHLEHKEMTAEDHEKFIETMGISKEEDENWHKMQNNAEFEHNENIAKPVNPFMIGGAFLDFCKKNKWIIQQGKGIKAKYFITNEGIEQLKAKFDIKIN
ncbi:MAG: hypothetical protein ACFFFH_02340 [Candidatus Thorarchaeota archaeon]